MSSQKSPPLDSPLFRLADSRSPRHQALLLSRGDRALALRTHLLLSATQSIFIQTFIWKDDECGRYVLYLVLEAARRGVEVKILTDCWPGLEIPSALVSLAAEHHHIEVKFYNPPAGQISPTSLSLATELYSDPKKLNQRMHNKLFVVDEKIAIIGGRNYENSYYDRGETKNFLDREVAVAGPVVSSCVDSFLKYWDSEVAYRPEELKDYKEERAKAGYSLNARREEFNLGSLFDTLEDQARHTPYVESEFVPRFVEVANAYLIADPPMSQEAERSPSTDALIDIFSRANTELLLQSPYFVLNGVFRAAFRDIFKLKPHMSVRVSTNSIASTDHVLSYVAALLDRQDYLAELPIRIFELKPLPSDRYAMVGFLRKTKEEIEQEERKRRKRWYNSAPHENFHFCLHSKSYVIDRQIAVLTSINLDPRSARINSEVGVVIEDAEFAKRLSMELEEQMAPRNSWPVGVVSAGRKNSFFYRLFFRNTGDLRTACFEPIDDAGKEVSCFEPEFLKLYRNVGPFPEIAGTVRHWKAALLAFIAEYLKPLI